MGIFGTAHGWGGGAKTPASLYKICHTYPTKMNLGTVIHYLKKIQKIHEPRDTTPTLIRNQQSLLYRKIQI